ncbi:MerR HTH family regulatory protein [Roseovarius pacificus]|uniref:MerR HTH family regulatory protein n=1 Tax=Roseovarius pacificus TaxID=337701 RepID=A0A1M7BIU2_9RHOB|nr:MerR family transcriptional regulator [Roseovarius pacificus]GGO55175.1 hypothetical protein GCM10011315_17090 [Roseovarius pacificus]SHL54955.1 MerR HTH family regulatory protein [Roseovarius pacificus]
MSIYTRYFSAGEVAQASGITPSTLQNWIKRDVIIGHKIEGGGSQGKHRRFSWHNVMEIATAAALVKAGVSDLGVAFYAAQSFAHVAHAAPSGKLQRLPALPYDISYGRTLLFVAGKHSQITTYKPGSDPFVRVAYGGRDREAFIVVDLLAVFDRVCVSLGLNPQEVMSQAAARGGA